MRYELITDTLGTYIWDSWEQRMIPTHTDPKVAQAHVDYLNNDYSIAWEVL